MGMLVDSAGGEAQRIAGRVVWHQRCWRLVSRWSGADQRESVH